MGVNKFAIKMLKVDKKQCSFFLISIVFSVAVIFNIFNIIYNENLVEFQSKYMDIFNLIALSVIGVAIFFTFFASSFFLLNKTKELGIAAICGLSTFDLAKILLTQSLIIIAIAVIVGIGIGLLISPIFLSAMYRATEITGKVFDISTGGIYLTIFFIGILAIYLVLFNWGYVYRSNLIELIVAKKQVSNPDTRMIKIPKVFYIVLFMLPIFLPFANFNSAEEAYAVFALMIVVTYGTQGVIRYFIPYKILELKKKYFFNDKLKLISLSNVYYSLKKAIPLVIILAIGSTLLISLIGTYNEVPPLKLISIFTYILITILISGSIIYKVLIETYNRRNLFLQLRMIGYSKVQIIKIILEEIIMFNLLIVGAPMFHLICILLTYIKCGTITIGLAAVLFLIFVFAYLISAVISYLGYKKIVIDYLYGGK